MTTNAHTASAEKAGLEEAAAEAVREASQEGRLLSLEDVLARLKELGFQAPCACPPTLVAVDATANAAPGSPGALPDRAALAWLAGILSSHPGIGSFESLSGQTLYHAPALFSRTYALILDRKGSPVELMAGEIRTNSREYPRPIPVGLFESPPFDLAPHEIEHALKTMAALPEYTDITFTITPSGVAYLFSTSHLERGYAEFLAERADSLAMNP